MAILKCLEKVCVSKKVFKVIISGLEKFLTAWTLTVMGALP
jgi:hypothetical protein